MSLLPGARLGPYEIVAPIGAGGMGEVYRAKDTRLDRDVAIKVLPAGVAGDADSRARFEREAKAVATLSHPNIVNIFDTGTDEGQLYVVMELLDGETLGERLVGGALTVRKTIDIAVQIAKGLAAAHDKALVHRDLKPENIFLLADGHVKILDFGLARQAMGKSSGATETVAALTNPGSVMGTVGYMAPEQVRGQAADARTDLFALGAVLYEMLSGQRAFQRDTSAETMTAILKEDPPELTGSRAEISPALDRIIRHCLEKNANERFQSARDVAFALESLSGAAVPSGGVAGMVPAVPAVAPRRWRWPAATAVLTAIALTVGVVIGGTLAGRDRGFVQFETKTWEPQWVTNARFTPDGQTLVFSAALSGNVPSLYAIRPGSVIAQPLGQPATHLLSISRTGELAVLTGASPRGHRIFEGTLARMTLDGAPRAWMENVSEADWSPDGSTLALIRRDAGKSRLEYPIGKVLHEAPSGYLSDPRVSPDGTRVAFFDHPIAGDNRGFVKVVDRGGVRTLAGEYWGEEGLAWSADGNSVLFSASTGGVESYRPFVVNAVGTPKVRQAFASAGGMLIFDVAADGRLAVIRRDARTSIRGLVPGESAEREFSWLDAASEGEFSRDGRRLLFNDQSQNAGADYAVALRDVATGQVVRLGAGFTLGFSPDTKWAAASVPSTGHIVLYPTGAGEPVTLDRGPIEHYRYGLNWFPDNRGVIVCGNEPGRPPRCYEQPIPVGAPRPITTEGVTSALLASDGRTLLLTRGATREVQTIGGGTAVARGFEAGDRPFAWTTDGRGVIVANRLTIPARVDRVDVATGQRTFIREFAPPDRGGLTDIQPSQWIDDGRGYAYAYVRELSKIFVVSGVGR